MNRCNPLITFSRMLVTSALIIAAATAPAYSAVDHPAPRTIQDLRSPDARDAARAPAVLQDLRSPDVARLRFTPTPMPEADSPVSRPATPSVSDANGFPWLEAGIALLLIGLGAATLRRRRPVARA